MKSIEASHQKAVIQWAEIFSLKYPCLKYLYACPNEGKHKVQYRVHQKAMGVKSGVPDLFLPFPVDKIEANPWKSEWIHGLYIEMKAGKNKPTKDQMRWIEYLRENGYRVKVCYSAEEAIEVIKEYLK